MRAASPSPSPRYRCEVFDCAREDAGFLLLGDRADVEPGLLALRTVAHADAAALRAHSRVDAVAVLLGKIHILQLHVNDRDTVIPECSLTAFSADLGEHGIGVVGIRIERDESG